MKSLTYILPLAIYMASTNVNAERIKRVYLDKKNNVHVISTLGHDIQITKTGNATSLKLAPDNESAAWLVMNKWIAPGDTEAQSEELKIYQDGNIKSIKCTLFIRDYWFWLNGSQIAVDCGGQHFAGWEILYDTKSLNKISSFDQDKVPLEKRPDWSHGDE